MKKIFKQITFYYSVLDNEEVILDNFFSVFKREYDRITNFFEIGFLQIPIYIVTKSELDTYVREKSLSYKKCDVPKWLDGFSTSESIHILIPSTENINEMVKVALHEIVHFIIYQLELQQPPLKVLDEGLAVYLSQQNCKKALNIIVNEYLANQLKNLSDFCIYDSVKFAELKGYYYSYFIAEFLILTYKKNSYINWLKNPNDFLEQLSNLDIEFREYITSNIKMVINKKNEDNKSSLV